MAGACVDVAVDAPGADTYTYAVPPELNDLAPGVGVVVPYGRRRCPGIVVHRHDQPPAGVTLKPVCEQRHDLRLPAQVIALVRWGAAYYRCHLGQFLAAAIPAPVRAGTRLAAARFVARVEGFTGDLTEAQKRALDCLPAGAIEFPAALRLAGCTRGVLDRLVAKGALALTDERSVREVAVTVRGDRHPLTDEQTAAISAIRSALDEARHEVFLLYGVTGSGKTLVYLELAEVVIAAGRQVLVLLPEIALTPQLAARFRDRFARVAVWHSGFSDGERAEQWQRVASGAVDLVVGTRSALFAPLPAPGLVVVDEEHDGSFKQDRDPRYHGRDLAVVYGRQLGVPVVLGTATPGLETYANAKGKRYRVLTLKSRPGGGRLPEPVIVDMAEETREQGHAVLLSRRLVEGLAAVRERGEQAIVLLNRRGWAPVVSCLACGHTWQCQQCDISLTFHRAANELRCHYCGHREPYPRRCPACGSGDISTKGLGTEQLETHLRDAVTGLRTIRVDADTVGKRQGHARLLAAFADGEADCLVGTQMVAKGLDFPRVTLVGIVQADRGLAIPDFRAAERTYQLVAQVAGRAGRGQRPGTVVVQAFDTEAMALQCALHHRARSFYEHELELRRMYRYPPAAGLVRWLWSGPDAVRVERAAVEGVTRLRRLIGDWPLLGPTPAGLALLQGQVRWHALLKAPTRGGAQALLDRLADQGGLPEVGGVRLVLDVDPLALS